MSKCKILFSLILFICSLVASAAFASYTPRPTACLVLDYNSGKVLYQENAETPVHPASLTKMMTLYLVFQKLKTGELSLQQRFRVSNHAAGQAPSKLGLKPGQYVSVEDLVLGTATRSANDAATVLAEGIGQNEPNFVAMMNRQAQALGMTHTVFYNASGLPNPRQYTTAADMAILGKALLSNQKNYYHFFGTQSFMYRGQIIKNHNHLLDWYEGTDGIKTGYVSASGFNIVASVTRNNSRLIGVMFGGKTAKARDRYMTGVLDRCFTMAAKTASAPFDQSNHV